MNWINIYGLVFMLAIMVPNIIFAVKNREGYRNLWQNRTVEILENVGRFGCVCFMVLILPGCGFGFSSDEAFALYLIINTVLTAVYWLVWAVCFRREGVFSALALSVLPSLVFLVSGAFSHYLPLLAAAVVFMPCHITVSYKNAGMKK